MKKKFFNNSVWNGAISIRETANTSSKEHFNTLKPRQTPNIIRQIVTSLAPNEVNTNNEAPT